MKKGKKGIATLYARISCSREYTHYCVRKEAAAGKFLCKWLGSTSAPARAFLHKREDYLSRWDEYMHIHCSSYRYIGSTMCGGNAPKRNTTTTRMMEDRLINLCDRFLIITKQSMVLAQERVITRCALYRCFEEKEIECRCREANKIHAQ